MQKRPVKDPGAARAGQRGGIREQRRFDIAADHPATQQHGVDLAPLAIERRHQHADQAVVAVSIGRRESFARTIRIGREPIDLFFVVAAAW